MNLDASPKSKWIGEPDYDFAVKDKDADTIFFSLTQMRAASPFDQHEGRGQPLGALLGRQGEGHLQTSLQSHHFATTSIRTNKQANTGMKYATQHNYLSPTSF